MRLIHKLYALIFGYFWLPCPVCKRAFGGHEISNLFTAALVLPDGTASAVCPDPKCSYEAGVLNFAHGHPGFVHSNVQISGSRSESDASAG